MEALEVMFHATLSFFPFFFSIGQLKSITFWVIETPIQVLQAKVLMKMFLVEALLTKAFINRSVFRINKRNRTRNFETASPSNGKLQPDPDGGKAVNPLTCVGQNSVSRFMRIKVETQSRSKSYCNLLQCLSGEKSHS